MATSSRDLTIKVWDVVNYKLKFTLSGHSNTVFDLCAIDDGYLASGSSDNSIKIWDVTNGRLKYTFNVNNGGHNSRVRTLASLPYDFLASGAEGILYPNHIFTYSPNHN